MCSDFAMEIQHEISWIMVLFLSGGLSSESGNSISPGELNRIGIMPKLTV